MKKYAKTNGDAVKKYLEKSVNGFYQNPGVIITDNQPNYAYINANKANLKAVLEAFKKDPTKVKFYNHFTYVGNTCYNGITKEMVLKAI